MRRNVRNINRDVVLDGRSAKTATVLITPDAVPRPIFGIEIAGDDDGDAIWVVEDFPNLVA